MFARRSTVYRFARLALMALAVVAPAVAQELSRDRIELVAGGPAPAAQPAPVFALAPAWPPAQTWPEPPSLRVVPRAQPVARFLLHRALLN